MKRILTSLVGLPILFVTIKFLPPPVFAALVCAAVILGCFEFFAIARKAGAIPYRFLGTALALAAATSFFEGGLPTVGVLSATILLIPTASVLRICRRGSNPDPAVLHKELWAMSATSFAVLWIGLLMGFTLALLSNGDARGRDLTVMLFWVVWLSDAGAYVVGSLIGRHKLAPCVSPKKTIEGAAGALAAALVASLVAKAWFFRALSLRDAVALGLLLGAAGMLGDLAESLVKRTVDIKDSGWLFPGHGGMLDRADSLLFAAPVLFYYHRYFMS